MATTKKTTTPTAVDAAPAAQPTPTEIADRQHARLLRRSEDALEVARGAIKRFTECLTTDPAYAMAESRCAFEAAAAIKVHSMALRILNAVDHDTTKEMQIGYLTGYATDETLRYARNPPSSTSAASNTLDLAVMECWATFADYLRGR